MFRRSLDAMSRRFPRFNALREWVSPRRKRLRLTFVIVMHVIGALSSVQAVMSTRTPQGAIAWAISLNTFPYVSVPAYWVFGQSKFDGYEVLRRQDMIEDSEVREDALETLERKGMLFRSENVREVSQIELLENLAMLPMTRHNEVELLIDGEATFDAIFNSISQATDYILVQFYIMRSDDLGNRLKEALLAKAAEGVRVYVMYDGLGSIGLAESYLRELSKGGVQTAAFTTTGRGHRFRLNFRNHRKIVVVDGREAFVGGHNVGDEYLGKNPELSPWRDTHVLVRGPVVLEAQVSFVEDWQWATGSLINELDWEPRKAPNGDVVSLCLPTGPADDLETATLFFLNAINLAQRRIWIVSPYFVPDQQLMSALQLAALRGVDVRVLIPENPDQMLVYLSSFSYLDEAEKAGVKIYRYEPGFLHQKVVLVDENLAAIGTANFDNRSMRLNFEVTMVFYDEEFGREVEEMLDRDFDASRRVSATDYTESSLPFRFAVRAARLLAPVQ